MSELELQALSLNDVALRQKKLQLIDLKNTYTFFDIVNSKENQGLFIEHKTTKVIDEEKLCCIFRERMRYVTNKLEEAEKQNGFLGKLWSTTKNFVGIGSSSNKVKMLLEK